MPSTVNIVLETSLAFLKSSLILSFLLLHSKGHATFGKMNATVLTFHKETRVCNVDKERGGSV